ncbi:wd repeat-containing protein [Ophiostoma piceae UAMH 11346]|uniref:Wd repeat-containing protein n=1 Tax=Ophiostoma piceae (strain UAMH 11346) TaxID=1262450 RepID=S3C1D9_OPHP1|nr:wd repeat-containing protein [Ophiostoma piceae UAMH 11346]
MASDLSDTESTDGSLRNTKIIKSAFDSESFDSDGTFQVDGLVGSATISPSGRDIALASPEGLAIIDLDSPYSAPRRVKSHGMPWLVVDVQWSPFAARDYWVASTANHCCLVWNLNRADDSSAGAVEHSLRGHRRSITDINFSAHHPDMLATCSVDGYVHCWDLRRPSTPALTFIDWVAGATQVKYNRQDEHVIASSHNRCVHIWDDRKASLPLRTIEAHTSKIYGLDWNRTRRTSLVTCSLDKTIKFWDYSVHGGDGTMSSTNNGIGAGTLNNLTVSSGFRSLGAMNETDIPERVIRTKFPIWRARHTPFGEGILAMPQTAPGHLYLYDARSPADLAADGATKAANDPVAVFPGHGHHKVKEFLWRTRGSINSEADEREFQLVSLGEDSKLRLRRLDGSDLAAVRYHRGQRPPKNLNITRRGAAYKTFRVLEDMGDYEKRSATMSSLRPRTQRSLPASQGQSRRESPTPEEDDRHHHHHHHHHHRHQNQTQTSQGDPHKPQQSASQRQTSRQQGKQPLPSALKSTSPSLPPPRTISSTSIMRDVMRSPKLTPQRTKHDHRISWRNPSMRAQTLGRRNADQTNEQLDWMKGVTLNKRKTGTEPAMTASQERLAEPLHPDSHRKVSSDSAMSSPMQMSMHDASVSMNSDLNEPESIHEEIKRITNKLPHVKWESVNMDKLSLIASMRGPWGVNQQPVFFKVQVDVPANYPVSRPPRFYIESSSLVPKSTQHEIADDLAVLTEAYLKRQRKCLLVAFRYLLGDIDLNGSLGLLDRALSNSRLVNDDSASSSSSSSEDETDAANNTFGDTIDGQAPIGPALPPPPPPRSCGAYFTRDGRLITFCLTKSGKASAKIMFEPAPPPTQEELSALQQPVFIGFGKVLPSRIGASKRQRKALVAATGGADWYNDPSSSDESDSSSASSGSGSSTTSSASSSSNPYHYVADDLMDPWSTNIGFQRRVVRGGKSDRKRRSSNDQRTFRSAYLDPDIPIGPQSTVTILDMRSYLPSKRELARDYAIFGDGAEVCEHNARVAEKHSEADLANIWRYAAMLLKSDVPLQLASTYDDVGRRQKSILVIARDAVAGANRDRDNREVLSGRVKWGLHPLAREFVNDLFDYFEQLADVQMLAMLSCIFGESFEEDSVAYAESHLSKTETPLPMKAPSFSLDYVPMTRGNTSVAPTPHLLLSGASTPGYGSASNNSSAPATPAAIFVDGTIDPDDDYEDEYDYEYDQSMWEAGNEAISTQNNSYSGGETPPNWPSAIHGIGGSTAGSAPLSASPSFGHASSDRFLRRGTAVVSAIATGVPQTLETMISSSPNERGGTGPLAIPTSSSLTRHTSFFSSTPTSSRQSPQARTTYLPSQTQRQPVTLHNTPNYRDVSYPTFVTQKLLAGSVSTSPRTTALGKLAAKLSSSPQDHGAIRKRASPAETIFSNLTGGNLTWAASALFGGGSGSGGGSGGATAAAGSGGGGSAGIGSAGNGGEKSSTEPPTAATSVSDEGFRRRELEAASADKGAPAREYRVLPEAPPASMVGVDIVVRTCNDHLFDDDGWMMKSLLGDQQQRRRRLYAQYRYAYSELLQVWSERLARLEVLKFNVLREDAIKAADSRTTAGGDDELNSYGMPVSLGYKLNSNSFFNGKHDQLVAMRDSGRGLDAVGVCQLCELQLEPLEYDVRESPPIPASVFGKRGGAVGICKRCQRKSQPEYWCQSQLRCVYCTEPVDAIYIPCFGCGCASHPDCLRSWYNSGEKLCAAGDECPCPEDATSGRVESWTALQAELMVGDFGQRYSGLLDSTADGHHSLQHGEPDMARHSNKAMSLITQARRSGHYAASSSLTSLEHADMNHKPSGSGSDNASSHGESPGSFSHSARSAALQPRPATSSSVQYDSSGELAFAGQGSPAPSGASAAGPAASKNGHASHLSPARLSLSSRLLGGSRLRGGRADAAAGDENSLTMQPTAFYDPAMEAVGRGGVDKDPSESPHSQ